ncbi:MAG: CZB domain-containing protein, partial [Planctomycetes bacterium]|nr:CZB domain-containing protein [Planctomycetota bacterium]
MFSNMTIGKKIGLAIGLVLMILVLTAGWAIYGIGGIVNDAGEVIYGNKLRGNIVQREVDHLNWANKVNELLTDAKVTTLSVQTDPRECAFGKWYYGPERIEAEKKVPELRALLEQVEEPHNHLHESAVDIGKVFKQANPYLPGILSTRKSEHLVWASNLRDVFLENKESIDVQTDPTKCALGKWLESGEAKAAYNGGDEDFKKNWNAMVEHHKKLHESVNDIKTHYCSVHADLEQHLIRLLLDHKDWVQNVSIAMIEGNPDLGVQTDPTKCAYGKFLDSEELRKLGTELPELKAVLDASRKAHEELHTSAIAIATSLRQGEGGRAKANAIFTNQTLGALNTVGEQIEKAIKIEDKRHQARAEAKRIMDSVTMPTLDVVLSNLDTLVTESEHELKGMHEAQKIYSTKTVPALGKIQTILSQINKKAEENIMTDQEMLDEASNTKLGVTIFGAAAIVIGIFMAFIIGKSIVTALTRIINSLNEGSAQVASAANQISGSSQSLAEGATEQAASLEETSSALEEMASMTRQNADNAQSDNSMMNQTETQVGQGAVAVKNMAGAMGEISQSSDEISKIIKTIEEIAFQTNLLALNA